MWWPIKPLLFSWINFKALKESSVWDSLRVHAEKNPQLWLVRSLFTHIHGYTSPLPQSLRFIAHGGDVLHDELDVAGLS